MVVVAQTGTDMKFSWKKLNIKTEARFRLEHSLMCGYSYVTTSIVIHYIEGPRPAWMNDCDMEKLSQSTKESVNVVKGVFGVEEVDPIHPHMVL